MSTALKDLLLKPLPSDTNHLVIAHRRYSLVIGDYKIIFSIAGMSRLYLTERLNDFLDILCHYQGIHPQTRLLSHHVEYESNDWMAAFNLSVAICLICGEILDGNGKGHCTKHVQYCNGETGMYFLVQDCTILITHGPRACYLPAPYVDEFGERHRHHRGKPLHLDQRMYDMLRKIWISHNIPREVVQKRSNSTRVIIFGHY
eukprot:gene21218-27483_t